MTTRHRIAVSLALAVALLTCISACQLSDRPIGLRKSKDPEHPTAVAKAEPKPTPSPVPVVADPWKPGMRQLGIQVYWVENGNDTSDAVVEAKARLLIDYAISLNANSIAITFPFYTYGIASDEVYADAASTPTPREIEDFLKVAAQSDIRVTLRPLLNEDALVAQNPLAWRGSIEPQSTSAWFQSYQQLLMPYAEAAQEGHAATFVIGTELESLEQAPEWPGVIAAIQSVYKGQLTYDENFDEFAAGDESLPLPGYDVDAYPRFDLPDTASVAALTQAWDAWLGAHPPSVLHQLVLSEVGIVTEPGAYQDPGSWLNTANVPVDVQVQANWYQAVCQAMAAEDVGGGIYWWEIGFDENPANPASFESDRLTFLGRPAAQVISSCFATLAGRPERAADIRPHVRG
jgi:hypothetical protein